MCSSDLPCNGLCPSGGKFARSAGAFSRDGKHHRPLDELLWKDGDHCFPSVPDGWRNVEDAAANRRRPSPDDDPDLILMLARIVGGQAMDAEKAPLSRRAPDDVSSEPPAPRPRGPGGGAALELDDVV